MHFHVPLWVFKALAAIGGFGFLYREVIKPLLNSIMNTVLQRRDELVWLVLKEPKYKPSHTQNNFTFYSKEEIPYPSKDIAAKTGRTTRSVEKSLRRLEKRGKVKEVLNGWKRKET